MAASGARRSDMIYKITPVNAWVAAEAAGAFAGSSDDLRDGFIHFSAADQVRATYGRYFSDKQNLLLVAVDEGQLGPALKWEISRRGETFPHLYATLGMSAVRSVVPIRRGPDGSPIFPPEIP
jgi:uncharacterized protein (DUF952 family)